MDFKGAFKLTISINSHERSAPSLHFCLSDHVHAIILINQKFFKCFWSCAVSIFSGLWPALVSPAAKCCYLIFTLTALLFTCPRDTGEMLRLLQHLTVCQLPYVYKWVDRVFKKMHMNIHKWTDTQTLHKAHIYSSYLARVHLVDAQMRGIHTHMHTQMLRIWGMLSWTMGTSFQPTIPLFTVAKSQYLSDSKSIKTICPVWGTWLCIAKPPLNSPHSVSHTLSI